MHQVAMWFLHSTDSWNVSYPFTWCWTLYVCVLQYLSVQLQYTYTMYLAKLWLVILKPSPLLLSVISVNTESISICIQSIVNIYWLVSYICRCIMHVFETISVTNIHTFTARAWNSSQPLAIFRPIFPVWPSKSNLLGQFYCTFPIGKPLIVYCNVPAFQQWPTNLKLLFQALPLYAML